MNVCSDDPVNSYKQFKYPAHYRHLSLIFNLYISARFGNIKDVNIGSVNNLASDFGKEARTSEKKVKEKVKILKKKRRNISGAKSLGGAEGRKRKMDELNEETFDWPSQSTTANSQPPQSQGVFNFASDKGFCSSQADSYES